MVDLVAADGGWSVVVERLGRTVVVNPRAAEVVEVAAVSLGFTCRQCGKAGAGEVDASQCGSGSHATDVTCGGCGAVEQVCWRSSPASVGTQ